MESVGAEGSPGGAPRSHTRAANKRKLRGGADAGAVPASVEPGPSQAIEGAERGSTKRRKTQQTTTITSAVPPSLGSTASNSGGMQLRHAHRPTPTNSTGAVQASPTARQQRAGAISHSTLTNKAQAEPAARGSSRARGGAKPNTPKGQAPDVEHNTTQRGGGGSMDASAPVSAPTARSTGAGSHRKTRASASEARTSSPSGPTPTRNAARTKTQGAVGVTVTSPSRGQSTTPPRSPTPVQEAEDAPTALTAASLPAAQLGNIGSSGPGLEAAPTPSALTSPQMRAAKLQSVPSVLPIVRVGSSHSPARGGGGGGGGGAGGHARRGRGRKDAPEEPPASVNEGFWNVSRQQGISASRSTDHGERAHYHGKDDHT